MSSVISPIRTDAKIIGLVSIAHLFSHFYHLAAAPFFLLIKDELGISFAALGFAVSMYYVVSGLLQTLAGVVVDRLGGRIVLVGGLVLAGVGTALIGAAPSYPVLVIGFMLAGAGNSTFHPADMAILNAKIAPSRLGPAFSVHGVGGSIGWVMAPVFGVVAGEVFGWRGALVLAGALGIALAAVIAMQGLLYMERHDAPRRASAGGGIRDTLGLLAAPAVVNCFGFFTALSVTLVALQTFSIATVISLYGVSQATASGILTGFLAGGTVGILAGGYAAMRFPRHGITAMVCVLAGMALVLLLATGVLPAVVLVVVMTTAGFFLGAVGPSRDIIVREITPLHARGRVYGFVYSGLDLGGAVAPFVFGWLLDHQQPRTVFIVSGLALLLCAYFMMRLDSWKRQ